MNTTDLKQLVNQISDLSEDEKKEVFKILDKHQVKYTENNNGIYIIISQVDPLILKEIEVFLDFCHKNKEKLESMDNAQMTEKEKIFGKEDILDEIENTLEPSADIKYTTKITYKKDLEKYGLNLEDNEEEVDVNLAKAKPKISGIKARIIKTGGKPKSGS